MRKNSGFTAFELAVSMAIMVVIAALVLPSYMNWMRSHRLKGAIHNLIGDMEMAKIRAIRENTFVVISFDTDRYTIFLDNGELGGDPEDFKSTGEFIVKTKDLPAGVQFDMAKFEFDNEPESTSKNATRFNGRGLPDRVNEARDIELKNKTNSRKITINKLGYLSVN